MLDNAEAIKVISNVHRSVRTRPQVSVMKPQKCDDKRTPIKITELIKPCSPGEMLRSHLDIGNANDMLEFSIPTESVASPAMASMMYWYFPIPMFQILPNHIAYAIGLGLFLPASSLALLMVHIIISSGLFALVAVCIESALCK